MGARKRLFGVYRPGSAINIPLYSRCLTKFLDSGASAMAERKRKKKTRAMRRYISRASRWIALQWYKLSGALIRTLAWAEGDCAHERVMCCCRYIASSMLYERERQRATVNTKIRLAGIPARSGVTADLSSLCIHDVQLIWHILHQCVVGAVGRTRSFVKFERS